MSIPAGRGTDRDGPDRDGPDRDGPDLEGPDRSGPDGNGPHGNGPDHPGSDRRAADPSGRHPHEAELVARLQAGDGEAFAALVRMHHPQLLRFARTFVRSEAVAEEVVQDTWLGVVRGIDRFAGRASVKTWLFQILANRARSVAVHEDRTVPLPGEGVAEDGRRFAADGSWAVPPDWSDDIDARVTAGALAGVIRAAIDALPSPCRQVVVLRDVEGLSGPEACEILGIADGYQRVLLHRGRVAVRRSLERTGGHE